MRKYIIVIVMLALLPATSYGLDKKLGTTNSFKVGIFDASSRANGGAGLDVVAPYSDFDIKIQCGNNTIVTMDESGDTIVDEGGGYYYVTTNDAITHNAEEECLAWVEGEGVYSGLIMKAPVRFKAVANIESDTYARVGAPAGASASADIAAIKSDTTAILLDTGTDGVVLANDAITAAKVAAGALGSSEMGEYSFTVVSSGDCINSAVLFDTNLTQTQTDHWKDAFATFTTGTLAGQTKLITGFNGTTKCMSIRSPGFSATPQGGDTGIIVNK